MKPQIESFQSQITEQQLGELFNSKPSGATRFMHGALSGIEKAVKVRMRYVLLAGALVAGGVVAYEHVSGDPDTTTVTTTIEAPTQENPLFDQQCFDQYLAGIPLVDREPGDLLTAAEACKEDPLTKIARQ